MGRNLSLKTTYMAKKIVTEPVGPARTLCIGADCDGAGMLTMELPRRLDFAYTTASVVPPRTKKERLAHGCEQRNNKFTGKSCKNRKCVADAFCKATDPPCGSQRAACPVQLVFVKGQPSLRFCKKKNKPGYLVPVNSPEQAQAMAQKACATWKKIKPKPGKNKIPWPSAFFERKAPDMVAKSRRAHPDSAWGKPGLGSAEPPLNPFPALGAATVAIALAIFKK